MQTIRFEIVGSQGDLYEIEAFRNGERVAVRCSCEAGSNGVLCKHRRGLIEGDFSRARAIMPGQSEAFEALLAGSMLLAAMIELPMAEKAASDAEAHLRALKKKIGRMMAG